MDPSTFDRSKAPYQRYKHQSYSSAAMFCAIKKQWGVFAMFRLTTLDFHGLKTVKKQADSHEDFRRQEFSLRECQIFPSELNFLHMLVQKSSVFWGAVSHITSKTLSPGPKPNKHLTSSTSTTTARVSLPPLGWKSLSASSISISASVNSPCSSLRGG